MLEPAANDATVSHGATASKGAAFPQGAAAGGVVLVDADGAEVTREALRLDVFGLRKHAPEGSVVALAGQSARLVLAAAAALEGWARRVDLVGDLEQPSTTRDAVVVRENDLDGGREPRTPVCVSHARVPTAWRLYSSGTTGVPSPTDHTLAALTRRVRPVAGVTPQAAAAGRAAGEPRRWGLLYPPARMAGLQVLLQALFGGDSVVDAGDAANLETRLKRFADAGVNALSATPTMWRMILRCGAASSLRLRQITLGGEIATQPLLNALRDRFDARITHVYASTEAGSVFSVNDGRAGFPRDYLRAAPGGVDLKIRDGILYVHAPESSSAGPDGFVSTGDLAEVHGDRVYFGGRASGLVNIGGDKVAPERIEELLRQHPALTDVVVIPRRNPITGWILTAQVVLSHPDSGASFGDLQSELRAFATRHLPRSHVPAQIAAVAALSLSPTGKARRA